MDLHDFWQENKRWILGVVLGLLVYWIGGSVITGMYSKDAVTKKMARSTRLYQEP